MPCGSTGESATLSHAEHRRVVEIVVRAARGRVPVLAGTGSNSTREAIELTRHAKEAGADGALLISPYYNKPTQEGIVAHYAEIARADRLPARRSTTSPGARRRTSCPRRSRGSPRSSRSSASRSRAATSTRCPQVIAAVPDDFSVLSGDDALTLPMLAIGGKGVISTTSNVAPAEMVELVRAFRAGDVDARARAATTALLPLFDALFCETNPIPVKAALALRGAIRTRSGCRSRRSRAPNRERLQVVLKELGLLLSATAPRARGRRARPHGRARARGARGGAVARARRRARGARAPARSARELAHGVRAAATTLAAALAACDVAIDFAHAGGRRSRSCARAAERGVAVRRRHDRLLAPPSARSSTRSRRASRVVHAANFSVAVNVLRPARARGGARCSAPDYDAEIVELHHARKLDAPSGTALGSPSAIADGRGEPRGERARCSRARARSARARPARSASRRCAAATTRASTR